MEILAIETIIIMLLVATGILWILFVSDRLNEIVHYIRTGEPLRDEYGFLIDRAPIEPEVKDFKFPSMGMGMSFSVDDIRNALGQLNHSSPPPENNIK